LRWRRRDGQGRSAGRGLDRRSGLRLRDLHLIRLGARHIGGHKPGHEQKRE
jgi:hypothetical protein